MINRTENDRLALKRFHWRINFLSELNIVKHSDWNGSSSVRGSFRWITSRSADRPHFSSNNFPVRHRDNAADSLRQIKSRRRDYRHPSGPPGGTCMVLYLLDRVTWPPMSQFADVMQINIDNAIWKFAVAAASWATRTWTVAGCSRIRNVIPASITPR